MRLVVAVLLLFLAPDVYSQNIKSEMPWKFIVPLRTGCAEVKKMLNVKTCVTRYESENFSVIIRYAGKGNVWKVRRDKVVDAEFEFKDPLMLESFTSSLAGYELVPICDLPGENEYVNAKKGISLSILETANDRFIRYLSLFPPTASAPSCKR